MADFCLSARVEFTELPPNIDEFIVLCNGLETSFGDPAEVIAELNGNTLTLDIKYVDSDDGYFKVCDYLSDHSSNIVPTCIDCWDGEGAMPFDFVNYPVYLGPESGRRDAMAKYYLDHALGLVRMGAPSKQNIEEFILQLKGLHN
jgi:hypothetical protein